MGYLQYFTARAARYWALNGRLVLMLLNDIHYLNCDVTAVIRAAGMDIRPAPMRVSLFC